ncbi:hypothetical protein [Defluviitalea phaphyphila]|uniref:hypothetical protein n=1 Tax=Defluviitalea phaphyphila TaxID=1473580 RepID=UPI0013660310|nr:hypothetical protein [Defluviitalea phaphyphila]
MKKVIYGKYILTVFKVAIFSLIIYILLNSQLIDGNIEPIGYINILFFNLSAAILSWINYNNSKNIISIFGVYILASISLFQQYILKLILSFIPLIICIKWFLKIDIDWGKFLEHSSYIYKSSSIAFRKDTAEMLSFIMENSKTVEYKINLSNFKAKGSWVIIAKGLVELFRKPKIFHLINGVIFLSSIILHSYNFFISLMLQVALVTNIIQLSTENLLSIINKQKCGLILPFSENEILYKTSSISIVFISIYFLIFTLIKQVSILKYILSTIIFAIIILIVNKLHIKLPKYNKVITVLKSMIYTCVIVLFYY